MNELMDIFDKRIILRNMAQCLVCKDVISSEHEHDYQECSCGRLAVDGGTSYLKRSFANHRKWKELSVVVPLEMKGVNK